MPIVASVVIEDSPQVDGRRAIRERHTDHLGGLYFVDYVALAGVNATLILPTRAAQLELDLASAEVTLNVNRAYDQVAPTFIHSTVASFRAALRTRFQTIAGWDAARLGKYIVGLGLSDGQYTTIFGVSGASLTALKNKLTALASNFDTTTAQVGS